MTSAILFSNPSFFSSEKGRLWGSAQTLSVLRSTMSCAAAGGPPSATKKSGSARVRRRHISGRLVANPRRPPAAENPIRARLQIGPDVVEISNDVLDLAKRRHDIGGGGVDVGSAVDDDFIELVLRHMLHRVDEIRPVGAAGAVRTMTAQARFGVAAPPIEGLLVDLPVDVGVGLRSRR